MNTELKSFRIASIEAQDLINALETNIEKGYTLIDERTGKPNYRRFNNILPASLDTIHLKEAYYSINRNRGYYFTNEDDDEKEVLYTNKIINVKFSVCFKEYIKKYDDVYIKAGFQAPQDISKIDLIKSEDGTINLIRIDKYLKEYEEIESDYFELREETSGGVSRFYYAIKKRIKNRETTAQLREKLYKDGCLIDGNKYVRYKRSSGASRDGHCLFIDERLKDKMEKWSKCGLKFKDGDIVDLPSYEAYQSLSLSSIISTIQLKKENFLFLDDFKCKLKNKEIMEIKNIEGNGKKLEAIESNAEVENNIWDGEALMDKSIFDSNSHIKNKGMALLRGRFFKTCAFNTNLKEWFIENGITEISQLNGITFAKSIDDIKIVVTDSSVKYLKFKDYTGIDKTELTSDQYKAMVLEYFLNEHGETFGIVKTEKMTSFFDGNMVMTSYQLLNTIRLERSDVDEFLKDSYDYLLNIKKHPKYMRFYLNYINKLSYDEYALEDENDDTQNKSIRVFKNEIIYQLLGLNDDFQKTELFKEFKNDCDEAYKKRLRNGHVLVHGTNATLFGNGYELLLETIGRFDRNHPKSILLEYEISSKMFDDDRIILGARSPHVTMGNILLAKNKRLSEFDRWFNLTREIVCVDAISTNIQQMLNGCDYDSDTMLLTDNELLIKAASKYYNDFKVPVNSLTPTEKRKEMTPENLSEVDHDISNNLVGQIINLSQELNSILWDRINKDVSVVDKDIKDIYKDICILACLSGMEIDKAKREYNVNSSEVLKEIREKCKKYYGIENAKPEFFRYLTNDVTIKTPKNRKKDEGPKEKSGDAIQSKKNKPNYVKLETTMDNVQDSITYESERQKKAIRNKTIKLIDLFVMHKPDKKDTNVTYRRKTKEDIIEILNEVYVRRQALFVNFENKDDNAKAINMAEANKILIDGVKALKKKLENEKVCYDLLDELSENRIGKIKWLLMYCFFESKGSAFTNLLKSIMVEVPTLSIMKEDGEVVFDYESELNAHGIVLEERLERTKY